MEKKLIHFKNFEDFKAYRLSASPDNTSYTIGLDTSRVYGGNPEILWKTIVFIKDTQQIWTHGQIYNGSVGIEDIEDRLLIKKHWDLSNRQFPSEFFSDNITKYDEAEGCWYFKNSLGVELPKKSYWQISLGIQRYYPSTGGSLEILGQHFGYSDKILIQTSNRIDKFTISLDGFCWISSIEVLEIFKGPEKLSELENDMGFLLPEDLDPLKEDLKKKLEYSGIEDSETLVLTNNLI